MIAWIKKEAYGTKKLFMMLHCVLFSVVSAGLWNFKIDGQKKQQSNLGSKINTLLDNSRALTFFDKLNICVPNF